MVKRKVFLASLSLLLGASATIGTYFGLATQDSAVGKIQAVNADTFKQSIAAQEYLKKNKEIFNSKSGYYRTGGNTLVATEHNLQYYKNLINELKAKGKNISSSDVVLLPSYYYDLLAKRDRLMKRLTYNGKTNVSWNYGLMNTLNMRITDHARDRGVLASFIDYIKKTTSSRNLFNLKMSNLTPFRNNFSTLSDACFNYDMMKNSKEVLKAAMGSVYSMLNCSDKYSFSSFSLESFLSTFLELEPKEIIVGKKPENYTGNDEFLPLEIAQKYSNDVDLKEGDRTTVFASITNILSNLDINKMKQLSGLGSVIAAKTKTNGTSSPVEILKKVIKNNSKIDFKSSNTLIAVFLSVLGAISKANSDAKIKYNFDSSIKDGDFVSTIITKAQEGLSNLVKGLLYDNLPLLRFFFNKVIKHQTTNKTAVELMKEKYAKKNNELKQRLVNVKKNKVSTIKAIDELDKKIEFLSDEKDELKNDNLWEDYLVVKKQIEYGEYELEILKEKLRINNVLLKSYKKQIGFLKDNPIKAEEITKLELKIANIKVAIASGEIDLKEQEISLRKWKDSLAEIQSNSFYKKYKSIEDGYFAAIEKRRHLEGLADQQQNDITKINAQIRSYTSMISKIGVWSSSTNYKEGVKALKELDFMDAISLFTDTTSLVTYDALATLKLGKLNQDGEFKFTGFNISGDLSNLSPFFKEKGAIEVINKLIDLFNNIVSKFSDNSLKAGARFLFNALPDSLFSLLNTTFSIPGINVNFRDGINITQKQVYGLLAGSVTGVGGLVGGSVGAIAGAIKGASKGLKGKYGLIGALVGLGVGLVAGATAGGITADKLFGDGNLKIHKPDKRIIDIVLDLKKQADKNKKITFNLFVDGHNLLKENYIPELNLVFRDLAKIFSFSNKKILAYIEKFNTDNKDQSFNGWKMVGEIMKTFLLSPKLWKAILDRSSYQRNAYDAEVFKQETYNTLKKELVYSKSLLTSISKNKSPAYINRLYEFQFRIIDWLFSSTYVTTTTHFISSKYNMINIGYKSTEIRHENLQKLVDGYKKVTGLNVKINLVDISKVNLKTLDAYLEFRKADEQILQLSNLDLFDLEDLARSNKPVTIPLYKTSYIPVTTLYNYRSNIDDDFLKKYYS